ncbi:hypothetical protein RCZ04_07140 [Capnocytophaga sp. HP1101]
MLKELFLKGNVKSVRVIPYEVKENKKQHIHKTPVKKFYYDENLFLLVNEQGNVIQQIMFADRNAFNHKTEVTYDDKNRETNLKVYDETDTLLREYTLTYDDKEKKMQKTAYFPKTGKQYLVLTSDTNKRSYPTYATYYNTDKSVKNYSSYKYDKRDNQLEATVYNPDKSIKYTKKTKYNKNGFVTHQITKSNEKNKSLETAYTYKKEPFPTEMHLIFGKTTNNKAKKVSYTFSYQYDEKGNWIEKKCFLKDKLVYIIERDITYY